MSTEFCPDHSEHNRAIAQHDKRLDKHSESIDDIKDDQSEMKLNLQKLTDIEKQNSEIFARHDRMLADHDQRISAIEDQPIKDVQRIKDYVLSAFGGAIGTGLIALLVLALVRSIGM
ncbi:MAG TPA: hypothetical protein OIM20_07625 [Eggerthellaceae bacterium]|nr:hypothetical protein [Eggerthellaceae bacterium]